MEKQDQLQMKRQNKLIVLEAIRKRAPISRIQLSKLTKMSPTTITRIVQELEEEGYIYEADSKESNVGRRPVLIHIRSDALYTVGVEVDQSNLRIGILNFLGELIAFQEVGYSTSQLYEETVNTIARIIENLLQQTGINHEKLLGIGIGIPGVINHEEGIVISSEQLKWRDCHLKKDLMNYFNCEVVIDNELKMQIISEIGDYSSPNYTNCILLGLGSGIGASVFLDGDVYRGIQNKAGEISHMTINPFGELCHCGNRGCLSTYISEAALIKSAPKEFGIQSYEQLHHAMKERAYWAIDIEQDMTTYLAIAINNLVCIYEPEAVIVSGAIFEQNEVLQLLLKEKCKQYVWDVIQPHVQIHFSTQYRKGVVKGAALQVQKQLLPI